MVSVALEDEVKPRRIAGVWRRSVRKHRIALVVIGIYLLVFFFPTLFMGRVVSPNDVYRHYEPWSTGEGFVAQNPVIHDPPMAYMPIAAMMKRAPESFHWNPWLAAGIPGWGSTASALLTPFALIPALLPLPLFYTGMILMKLFFAFVMTYLWLREERLGKARAAIGALVGAASGPMFVLWLWQSTNATVLYPALLYAIARMMHGKRNSVVALTLLGIGFLLSGYPASILFGLWLGIFHGFVQMIRMRRVPLRELGRASVAAGLALMITAPVLDPFVSFLQRTGYLEWREGMSRFFLPPAHLWGLIDPELLGNPARGLWRGDPSLGALDNYVELTIWVGPIALLLALLSPLDRRARGRVVAWLLFGATIIMIMVGWIDSPWILDLPGLRYSPMTRLRILFPVVFAFLAACGLRGLGRLVTRIGTPVRESVLIVVLGAFLAYDHARIAASFHPFLPFEETRVEFTESLEFLQGRRGPFRVAPTFYWMRPNSSQMFGVEDIRSQWSSESAYREIILRIDPGGGSIGSVLLLSSLTMNVEDPFLRLLNVRYVIEPPAIDILRWRIEEKLKKGVVPDSEIILGEGESVDRYVALDLEDVKAIELTARPAMESESGRLSVALIRPETGERVAQISRTADQLRRRGKIHVPVPQFREGEVAGLQLSAHGTSFLLPSVRGRVFARPSASSLALVDEGIDARIYELVDTLPRYWATWEIANRPAGEIFRDRGFDFGRRTALEEADPAMVERFSSVPLTDRRVRMRVLRYRPATQMIEVDSRVPFLFNASEKLTPELRVRIDDEEIVPLRVNGLFIGFPVEPGRHRIVLERRIGRDWWLLTIVGLLGLAAAGVTDRRW